MIVLLTVLFTILYCFEVESLLKSLKFTLLKGWFWRVSRYLLVAAWSVCILYWQIPLPFCYGGIYLIFCLSVFGREHDRKDFYIINVQFAFFAAVNLIVLGAMALYEHVDINEVLLNPQSRGISIILTTLVNTAGICVLLQLIKRQKDMVFAYEKKEFWLLQNSMWFWVVFTFTDSIPSMFRLPTDLVSMFLISSNLLILFLVAFFHVHVYRITQNAYLEEEKARLKQEERQLLLRTALAEKDAYIDHLTGAYTRTYVKAATDKMLRSGTSFSMVYIDLDSLKRINDTGGHLKGDEHLQIFVRELQKKLGKEDILARIGGDEFLILMPRTAEEPARECMSAMRESMEKSIDHKIFYSYGVVYIPGQGIEDIAEYLKEADHRMYEDKELRR